MSNIFQENCNATGNYDWNQYWFIFDADPLLNFPLWAILPGIAAVDTTFTRRLIICIDHVHTVKYITLGTEYLGSTYLF
jgi:hypothetical protein